VGTASWYGRDFDGKKTASGEVFDSRRLTAAHKTLPLGSIAVVKNLENGKEILVTVNDRGPFKSGRILDVSEYAAEMLGFKERGLTTVGVRMLRTGEAPQQGSGATFDQYGKAADGTDLKDIINRTAVSRPEETKTAAAADVKKTAVETPVKEEVKKDEKATVIPEDQAKGYGVQVGSFEDLVNAKRMASFLTGYGAPVNIVQRGDRFIVKVGSYASRYRAEELKYKLVADGYNGFIAEH
jgi:rare lipoprotein A